MSTPWRNVFIIGNMLSYYSPPTVSCTKIDKSYVLCIQILRCQVTCT